MGLLSGYRDLNGLLKRQPYPMPKMCEILLKLEAFQYTTSLDLKMGCYRLCLIEEASNICTIIIPWGKYKYKRLPMGVCNSPDIFWEKMNEMFRGFEFI